MNSDYNQTAMMFKALSHPVRSAIIAGLIFNDECNVSWIVDQLGIPQPTVSQHINILKSARIIEGYRKGNQICYKVVNNQVRKIFEII